jgi:hypothetical protein
LGVGGATGVRSATATQTGEATRSARGAQPSARPFANRATSTGPIVAADVTSP